MSKIVDLVSDIAQPLVENLGCELWDVEYVSEGGQWFLRIYIDKSEGVSIDDCEAVSRAIDPILDEVDPIATSYTFEVSSAGLDRALKKPEHFKRFLGELVEVKLFKPLNGAKTFTGELTEYKDGNVTISVGDKSLSFTKAQVAVVRVSLV